MRQGDVLRVKRAIPAPIKRQMRAAAQAISGQPRKFEMSAPEAEAALARYGQIPWPDGPRIIYALTPTAALSNVGDQAQVVAIRAWLARHYPDRAVVEIDKDVVLAATDMIAAHVRPDDLIFLHSGGNLGDRGLWSETGRRRMIDRFPGNRIVSLPQTIYFSDTIDGRLQRRESEKIYNAHRRLTVLGRDRQSGQLAAELFPNARIGTFPDFVLSLSAEDFDLSVDSTMAGRTLACLRVDDESIFSTGERESLAALIGGPVSLYDTTLAEPIQPDERVTVLARTLSHFASHDSVVTDRYHGLIFSVICRKPTVVLRTVDHKLTSAIEWFADIPNVRFCEDVQSIPRLLDEVRAATDVVYPDFNALYFDRIPAFVGQKI